jgi:hypothetical protein
MAHDETDRDMRVSIIDALGASNFVAVQRFLIYLPNKNRHGNIIESTKLNGYVKNILKLLGEINEGATAYPEMEGIYWKRGQAQPVLEKTIIVYSDIDAVEFYNNLHRIRYFLHQFGRETDQDRVYFEFSQKSFRIDRENFDEP